MPWRAGGIREVGPGSALTWDSPQHSPPVSSDSSARHLRREGRNEPALHPAQGAWGLFFLSFSYQVSHSIYSPQCKKGAKFTPCSTRNAPVGVATDALSVQTLVAMHVRNYWLPLCVCVWSNTTSRAGFPPDFELKMAQSFSYLHVPHGQLKCSY